MSSDNSRKEQLVAKFKGQTVRVTLSDERVVVGRLECFDSGKNIILGDTVQVMSDGPMHMGYIMLPGNHVRRLEASTAV